MLKQLSDQYELLVNMIIRPPRFTYQVTDLGPKHFFVGGVAVKRTDFELNNSRGLALQCSHFEPVMDWGKPLPCVIYCHGNGGGRIDALESVAALLPCMISVVALDFSGSGLSDGEYVSLGYWEKEDVSSVVQYLRSTGRVTSIGLWGRSMGAVTSLFYAKEDPSVASLVLDSPFSSLQRVAEELVLNFTSLAKTPRLTKMAVGLGLRVLRATIKKKAQFDLKDLEVVSVARACFVPSLFVHGQNDTFVRPQHSVELYESYGGDKTRMIIDGDHNSARPQFFLDSAVIFFCNTLLNGQPPPHTDSSYSSQSSEDFELIFQDNNQDNNNNDNDNININNNNNNEEEADKYIVDSNQNKCNSEANDNHVNGVVVGVD